MQNNLAMIMGAKLLSITDVYRATGISRSTLSGLYRRQAKMVQFETLTKLCDFLQIPLSELIEYTPPIVSDWRGR